MTIKRIYFAAPVPLPLDAACTSIALYDKRYQPATAEVKANGVQLMVTADGGATHVYVPLAHIRGLLGEPDAPPTKGK